MHRRSLIAAAIMAVALVVSVVSALAGRDTTRPYSFQRIAGGFANPTFVTSAPDDAATLYVVEQAGTIKIVRGGETVGTFLDISSQVLSEGEHGLLSIAFHPAYAQNHLCYVDYTDLHGDTHVVEFRSENGVALPSSARELLFVAQPYPNHKGGQLAFDHHGYLYVGMGDGGTNPASGPTSLGDPENHAQDPGSRLGKLLRIDPTKADATWQVVGYGLRNPWRFSFDRATGDLWLGDVGAAKSEEIDYRPAAQLGTVVDYGWSRFEGRLSYNKNVSLRPGMKVVSPVFTYNHDFGAGGVIGGYVYRGKRVPAARGRYFFGDLGLGVVWTLNVAKGGRVSKQARLPGSVPYLSSFGEDAKGELYALAYGGVLYALR